MPRSCVERLNLLHEFTAAVGSFHDATTELHRLSLDGSGVAFQEQLTCCRTAREGVLKARNALEAHQVHHGC
jgi:hypothetical protein